MDNEIKKLSRNESRKLDALVNECDSAHYESRNDHLSSGPDAPIWGGDRDEFRAWQTKAQEFEFQMQDFENWFSGR